MGGSAFPTIDPATYTKLSTDKRVMELAKKYGYSIPKTMPTQTAPSPATNWQFPQYSQTWAFTPPTPTPMQSPPPFNAATYGKDSKKDGDGRDGRDGDGGSRSGGGGERYPWGVTPPAWW